MKKLIILLTIILANANVFAQAGDPWITEVYKNTWGRAPSPMEYNITNYNGGHWNNKVELMKYIYEFQKNMASAGITYKYSQKVVNGNVVVGVYQNGSQIAADLISNQNGAIVAQGGGNIISTNGSGVVGNSGGTLVAQGGGNIVIDATTKGAYFGAANARVPLGTGNMVIKTSSGGAFLIK